jgi:hypothetical protein
MMRIRYEKAILAVSDGKCFYCSAPAVQADHVVPMSRGGTDALHNLVPACSSCNLKKRNNMLPAYHEAFALAHAANLARLVLAKGWKVYGIRKPPAPADYSWIDEIVKKVRICMRDPESAKAIRAALSQGNGK